MEGIRKSPTIIRNVGGYQVYLELISADPFSIRLDINNPRISYSLEQLPYEERNDSSCELLLSTQEDVERLKRSIMHTQGVQEPIFITHEQIVVEGNRRLVALRELKREFSDNPAFSKIPALLISRDTPKSVIDDLINSAHLDPKRPWAPFERALVLRRLFDDGLDSGNLADRYEMNRAEVKQFIEAVNIMLTNYVPLMKDPNDPEIITKFSYFLEYVKGRMINFRRNNPDLDGKFAHWVWNGNIPKAEAVRQLPKILESEVATSILNSKGYKEAMNVLASENPSMDQFYGNIMLLTKNLEQFGTDDLLAIKNNQEKLNILMRMKEKLDTVIKIVGGGK